MNTIILCFWTQPLLLGLSVREETVLNTPCYHLLRGWWQSWTRGAALNGEPGRNSGPATPKGTRRCPPPFPPPCRRGLLVPPGAPVSSG